MAAITRDEFFEKKQKGALWDVGVSINRTNPLPLDKNAVFASESELDTYIGGVLAYPGQTVAVVSAEGTQLYVLGYVGGALTKQEIGKPTEGDGKSITLNEEGILSVAGFSGATNGQIPQKNADGGITWVANSQGSLASDLTAIKTDISSLKSKDTELSDKITNLGTVLSFEGSLTPTQFSGTTNSDNLIVDTSKYKTGKVVLVDGEEYVSVEGYHLTNDTTVQSGKTYYTKSGDTYTAVSSPAANPKTAGYYVKGNIWEELGDTQGLIGVQTDVKNLKTSVDDLAESLGTSADYASASGSAYARINQNTSDLYNAFDFINAIEVNLGNKTDPAATAETYDSSTSAFSRIGYLKNRVDDSTTGLTATRALAQQGVNNAVTATTAAETAQKAAEAAQKTANAAMPIAGGAFTGDVTTPVATTAFSNKSLVSKEYVDSKVDSALSTYVTKNELTNATSGLETKIETAQGVANGAKTQADTNATNISNLDKKVGTLDTDKHGSSVIAYVEKVEKTANAAATSSALDALETKVSNNKASIDSVKNLVGTKGTESATSAFGAILEEEKARTSAIATAKTELIGNASDAATANTINAAKTYAKNLDTAMSNRVSTVETKLSNVTTVMDFIGVSSTAPTATKVTIGDKEITSFQKGDVVLYGNKEYVWDGTEWVEFGDTTADADAITKLTGRVSDAEGKIAANTGAISTETTNRTNDVNSLKSQITSLTEQLTWSIF